MAIRGEDADRIRVSASIATTSTGLYAIGNVTGVTVSPSNANNNLFNATPGVVQSYTTQNGQIVMSNVGGDPITYPNSNNPGFFFRQGQAVQYIASDFGGCRHLGNLQL